MSHVTRDASYAMSEAIYAAGASVLESVLDIDNNAQADAGLRESVVRRLRDFVTQCRRAGIPDDETAEARYALVAFVDDRVLRSNWAGKTAWSGNPLQVQFFREYAAGENFSMRMAGLAARDEPSLALEIYCLCLALGFEGASSKGKREGRRARELEEACEALRFGARSRIAPNAIPAERPAPQASTFPFARIATVACVAFVAFALIGLQWSLRSRVHSVLDDMARLSPATSCEPMASGNNISADPKAPLPVDPAP